MLNRISKLADKIIEEGLDAYVIARHQNIRYYTESLGGNFLVVIPDRDPILLVSSLDENVARDQAKNCDVESYRATEILNRFAEILRGSKSFLVGFDDLAFNFLDLVGKRIPEIDFKQNQGVVWAQRSIKDSNEVKLMIEAGRLADTAMEAICENLRVGVSENRLAAEASYSMMREGAEAHAFEFTVGSGPRSAYPHASSTERKIGKGDLIVVDIGAQFKGYCSDITRTFIVGEIDAKRSELYETVLRSHDVTYAAIRSGITCRELDAMSRKIIDEAGYGSNYTHSLGHGVGLEIHEPPSVGMRSDEILVAGNVISDEPGIYFHGFGGVRIEDTILVEEGGAKRLTDFPRDIGKAIF